MRTSINLVLTGRKRFPLRAWIPITGSVLWNVSVTLEYVDVLLCECFTLALVGLDNV